MPQALCAGPPRPGEDCATKGGTVHIFDHLQRVVAHFHAQLSALGDRGEGGVLGRREKASLRAADRYIELRLAGEAARAELLALVAPNVTLTSSRDGRYVGRAAFERYLAKVPPAGKWQGASWNRPLKRAEVRGMVKILVVPVPVVAHFSFDKRGLISDIYVGRR